MALTLRAVGGLSTREIADAFYVPEATMAQRISRAEVAMVETPDGHGRLELTKFHAPSGWGGDRHAPANTPGIRHVAFAVDDIDAVVAGLRARGAELVGVVERFEDSYRLCYVRGPEGIIVELAEQIA